jgi:hypothetical protein
MNLCLRVLLIGIILSTQISEAYSQVTISLDSDPTTPLNGTTVVITGSSSDTEVNAIMSLTNNFANSRDFTVRIVKRIEDPVVDQFCSGVCIEKNATNSVSDSEWVFPMTLSVGAGETVEFKPGYQTQGLSFCAINDYYVENQFGTKIDSVRVKFVIGVQECFLSTNDLTNSKETISVYPNPASGFVQTENTSAGDLFELHDMLGKSVLKVKLSNDNAKIFLDKLPDGVYFYSVRKLNGSTHPAKKLVIRH